MIRGRVETIRWWMLASQQSTLFGDFFRSISRFVMWRVGRCIGALPGVAAVYSRHTHPGSRTFVPGHSDLDLTIVLENDFADDPFFIRECSVALNQLYRRYFFVKPEDARFMSRGELLRLCTDACSSFELLCRAENWLLVAGKDARPQYCTPLPSRLVPRHPEFNRWWENVIQTQFFRPTIELRRGFMRSLYRTALKNQVQFETARGRHMPKREGSAGDELSDLQFNESPELRAILTNLKSTNLWSGKSAALRIDIFFEVLKGAEKFFAGSPAGQHTSARRAHPDTVNASLVDELRTRLSGSPEVATILRSAVVYALPHTHVPSYRMDLLLRQDFSASELGAACQALSRLFGEKNFEAAGCPVEFTLIPWGVYETSLFFLGLPWMFLLEHVRKFSVTIYGGEEICLPDPIPREDLLDWCRIFLPYHMVTFRRRLEYSSPVLNFCQLASLQIFVEKDERMTDALAVRKVYMEEFVKEGHKEAVDYLFHYPCDPGKTALYDQATACVAQTYAVLESLLEARQ